MARRAATAESRRVPEQQGAGRLTRAGGSLPAGLGAQRTDRVCVIGRAEDRGAGDQDVGAGDRCSRGVVAADAAVDLDEEACARGGAEVARSGELLEGPLDQ